MALTAINSDPTMGLGAASGGSTNFLQPTINWQQPAAAPVTGATGSTGGYSTGGSGGSAPATVDPSIYQYYDNMAGGVQSQIDRLGPQQQVGAQNIADAYNTSYNQLTGQKALAQRNYTDSSGSNLNNEVTSQGDIGASVGQQTNALQRLLGAAGFGNSTAANEAVPYATGLVGAQQNRQVQNTYAKNQQGLDTNWGDYQNQWNQSAGDLGHQRDLQTQQLQASIDTNKASLLQQLSSIAQQRAAAAPGATYAQIVAASQPYQQQISSLGSQIDQLGQQYSHPVIQAAPVTYNAPQLDSYNYNPNPGVQVNGAPGAASNLGAFTNLLLNPQQQQQGQTNLAGQQVLA